MHSLVRVLNPINTLQTPGKSKGRRGRGKKTDVEDPADQTVSQPARTTRATRSRARADNSVLEVTVTEPLNTTRTTRRTTRTTRRITRTKTAEVVEDSAVELQPKKSNKR